MQTNTPMKSNCFTEPARLEEYPAYVQTTATVQVAEVGMFTPSERYGSLVVKNESAAAFHSDDVESHVVFDPIVPEVQ